MSLYQPEHSITTPPPLFIYFFFFFFFLHIHIFLSSKGCLCRVGRSVLDEGFFDTEAKIGGLVPPGGPLILLLSVITHGFFPFGNSLRAFVNRF